MSAPETQKAAVAFLAGISLTGSQNGRPIKSSAEIHRESGRINKTISEGPPRDNKKVRKRTISSSANETGTQELKLVPQKIARSVTERIKDRKVSPRNTKTLRENAECIDSIPNRFFLTTGMGMTPYAICSIITIGEESRRKVGRSETTPAAHKHYLSSKHIGVSHVKELMDTDEPFDADLVLDDPSLSTGRHRTVMNLPGVKLSVFPYVKKKKLKEELNEKFKRKYQHINVKLTSIRSVKKKILQVVLDPQYDLDLGIAALAYVYFERLVILGIVTPENRKQYGGICLLLAAKFYHHSTASGFFAALVEGIEKHLQTKDIRLEELRVFIALHFKLCVDPCFVKPHYALIQQRIQRTSESIMKQYRIHNNPL